MARSTGGSHPRRPVRIQPAPAVLERRTGESYQPESHDFHDCPVPPVSECRGASRATASHHGGHPDCGGYCGHGGLCTAGQPTVPLYDNALPPAADEPRFRRPVCHCGGGSGQLQTGLMRHRWQTLDENGVHIQKESWIIILLSRDPQGTTLFRSEKPWSPVQPGSRPRIEPVIWLVWC